MGMTASKQDESGNKDDKVEEEVKPADEDQSEYKGDNKEPVSEEKIVPKDVIQVGSIFNSPTVSCICIIYKLTVNKFI